MRLTLIRLDRDRVRLAVDLPPRPARRLSAAQLFDEVCERHAACTRGRRPQVTGAQALRRLSALAGRAGHRPGRTVPAGDPRRLQAPTELPRDRRPAEAHRASPPERCG
ncbi:hypothetical protein LT493_15455 [Streptomyces tricolor]|nr:hypothetical protein [Streptomyces tricolor]